MIKKSNTLLIKFVVASFIISLLAVTLGFFGTHMILSSQERRMENHFMFEALRTIELIAKKTDMPIEEIVAEYNTFEQTPFKGEQDQMRKGPRGGPRRGPPGKPPILISVITRNEASFNLPANAGESLEIPSKVSDVKRFKDQVYNYDGEHFLVFKFDPVGPGRGDRRGDKGPRMPGPPGGPGGPGPGGPQIDIGGRPLPMFMVPLVLTFVIILFVITASSLLVLYFLKRQAQKAAEVLRALKLGDLKARFPTTKLDEASELMLEFNQMADEIEKLVVDLRDVDSLRRKLLQELAHDLRTPVASMKSMLESLLYQGERMDQTMRKESLEMSLKEVDYFHHLVEDLLFLSGVHDLKYRGKFATVDVNDVIQHEVQVAGEINKKVKVNFIFDEFYFIKADQHLFQRLMKNALSNAVSNAESMVAVRLIEEDKNTIFIEITNDGTGLTPEDIATFGKKRATRRINENTEGKISVGLGAVIMNKICEIHSAELKIENNTPDGKSGATLRIRFPHLGV